MLQYKGHQQHGGEGGGGGIYHRLFVLPVEPSFVLHILYIPGAYCALQHLSAPALITENQ